MRPHICKKHIVELVPIEATAKYREKNEVLIKKTKTMKKFSTILAAILLTAGIYAQSPQKMSYQSVIRNSSSQLITNQSVGMKISILQGSAFGTSVYVETQTSTTNANGLVTIEIGGGTPVTGTFATVNWANGPYFLKTETDPAGGTNYTITGTSQLLSMPYALYAKTAENGFSGNYNDLTNKPSGTVNVLPRIANRGQKLSVSFSGGDNLTFSQSSSTCPDVYANVILTFTQGSPTTIYPTDRYYIDSKRFDAVFSIPAYAPSGLYDIIIGPSTSCPYTLTTSFKIY